MTRRVDVSLDDLERLVEVADLVQRWAMDLDRGPEGYRVVTRGRLAALRSSLEPFRWILDEDEEQA